MSAVQLCEIGKSFKSRSRADHSTQSVLSDLNLQIESGHYVVLLGPSGCGKTTTLRMIAGLGKPDRGRILLHGEDVTNVPPRRRDVAMVFQGDALYPHLTIRQSMRYALKGVSDAAARIKNSAAQVGIDHLLDRRPSQLSGGELRRAAVAKGISRGASIRLLDEPLSAIDASAVHSLQDQLLRWHHEYPGTTLHVTHDGNEAMRLADRIAVMHEGRIAQYATPDEIYCRPATKSVAMAIGWPPMSFFMARNSAGGIVCDQDGISTKGWRIASTSSESYEIGVRPESWNLVSGESSQDASGLVAVARVQRIRQSNDRMLATVTIGSRDDVSVILRPTSTPSAGDSLSMFAPLNELHLFNGFVGISNRFT